MYLLLLELQDLLPGIINQLGPDNLANLKKIAETYSAAAQSKPGDDDVPELVENFDEAAQKKEESKEEKKEEVKA